MLLLTPMVRYQPTRPSRAAARCSSDEACAPNMTPAKSAVPWKKPESTWPLASSPSSLAAPSAAALQSFLLRGAWGVRSAFRALQTSARLRSDCRKLASMSRRCWRAESDEADFVMTPGALPADDHARRLAHRGGPRNGATQAWLRHGMAMVLGANLPQLKSYISHTRC